MSWTVPITWTSGQVVGASDLNNHIRDNSLYLASRPYAKIAFATAGIVISSTSYVKVDSTNLQMSISTSGGARVKGYWYVGAFSTSGALLITLSTQLDSITNDAWSTSGVPSTGTVAQEFLNGMFVPFSFAALSVGVHTFALIAKVSGGSATIGLPITTAYSNDQAVPNVVVGEGIEF